MATLYHEDPGAGRDAREQELAEWQAFLALRREQALVRRRRFFTPDFASPAAYEASLGFYRPTRRLCGATPRAPFWIRRWPPWSAHGRCSSR